MKIVLLCNAGYREKVYCKSRLAELGLAYQFEWALTHFRYDPYRDEIIGAQGQRWKVRLEGSGSLEVLAKFGLDGSQC